MTELIPRLPFEIAVDCLLRLPMQTYATLAQVCSSWRTLVRSPDFIAARRSQRYSNHCVCMVQSIPDSGTNSTRNGRSANKFPVLGITVFNSRQNTWERLPEIDEFRHGLPLFCQCCAIRDELFIVGGWDPVSFAVSRSVNAYSFGKGKWRRCAGMPSERSFFACAAMGGKIMVAGGHGNSKKALRTVECYDPEKDAWEVAIADMQEERDECKAVAMAGKLVVMGGYKTETQGQFSGSCESFEYHHHHHHVKKGAWSKVEMVECLEGKAIQAMVEHQGEIYTILDGELLHMTRHDQQDIGSASSFWDATFVTSLPPQLIGGVCVAASLPAGIVVIGGRTPSHAFIWSIASSFQKLELGDHFNGVIQASCTICV